VTVAPQPVDEELSAVAAGFGVEPGYWDVTGRWHDASVASVLAVLESLGAPIDRDDAARTEAGRQRAVADLGHELDRRRMAPIDPVVRVVGGRPADVELRTPGDGGGRVRVEVVLEGGGELILDVDLAALEPIGTEHLDGRTIVRRSLPLPACEPRPGPRPDDLDLPVGYHELRIDDGTTESRATLLVAPEHVHQLGGCERLWGAFAPVYALRSSTGLGPDVGDLGRLARWIDRHGGRIVATLPMLSAYLDEPYEPSPYSPVSRRFWNESYIELSRLPELDSLPAARALLERPDVSEELRRVRDASPFDPGVELRPFGPCWPSWQRRSSPARRGHRASTAGSRSIRWWSTTPGSGRSPSGRVRGGTNGRRGSGPVSSSPTTTTCGWRRGTSTPSGRWTGS
jgi:4-alpha-glucanotransferase